MWGGRKFSWNSKQLTTFSFDRETAPAQTADFLSNIKGNKVKTLFPPPRFSQLGGNERHFLLFYWSMVLGNLIHELGVISLSPSHLNELYLFNSFLSKSGPAFGLRNKKEMIGFYFPHYHNQTLLKMTFSQRTFSL